MISIIQNFAYLGILLLEKTEEVFKIIMKENSLLKILILLSI